MNQYSIVDIGVIVDDEKMENFSYCYTKKHVDKCDCSKCKNSDEYKLPRKED